MKTFKVVQEEKKVVDGVRCNKCDRAINLAEESFLDVFHRWGYHSEWDLEIHSFELCMSCYKELIASFKNPVAVGSYMPFSGQTTTEPK